MSKQKEFVPIVGPGEAIRTLEKYNEHVIALTGIVDQYIRMGLVKDSETLKHCNDNVRKFYVES